MARLPQPPMSNDNAELHRSMQDVIRFLRQIFDQGAKHPEFSQAQIDSFTDLSFLGTVLFNSDTGESNVSYLDAGQVKWRAI